METIEIQDGLVRLYRSRQDGKKSLDRQVALGDFLKELSAQTAGLLHEQFPLLPVGARWLLMRGPSTVVAIEEAPQVRRVSLSDRTGGAKSYLLAFPYIVYLLFFYQGTFEEMRLYYRKAPLTSQDDPLLLPNLWNVSASESPLAKCRACLRGRPPFEDLSLAGQAQEAVAFFWNADFGLEVEENCFQRAMKRDPLISSPEAWEVATKADPLFPLQVEWEEAKVTLRKAGEHLLDWRGSGRRIEEVSDLADLIYRLRER